MTDNETVARRWFRRQRGLETKPNYSARNRNFYGDERALYSFGSHFPMVEPIRTPKAAELIGWLVNGDVFSMTTRRHQSTERQARRLWGGDLPSVTIPFRALDAAGIDHASVRIVEVTADRNIPHTVTTHTFPEGAVWKDDVVIDDYSSYVDKDGNPWVDRFSDAAYRYVYPSWDNNRDLNARMAKFLVAQDEQRRGKQRPSHTERNLYVSKQASNRGWVRDGDKWFISIADNGERTYTRTWSQHLLGESLISAEVAYRTVTKCKACGGFGKRPGVQQHAYNALDGLSWGFPEPFCSPCNATGRVTNTRTRRAFFLSGFDHQESTPSYFFCELPPKARPTTVEEAYEALKPEAVKIAEQLGRTVVRQGDIFAIPLVGVTKRDLTKQGARFVKRGQLLSTNHVATEVAYLPDGTTLARGTLTHAPEGRRPDHKRQSIGKSFAVVQKNTVPLTV